MNPSRRSVHAHVIFWLHDDDANEAMSKIRSCMPAAWDPLVPGRFCKETNKQGMGDWIVPDFDTEPLRHLLFKTTDRKQVHKCTKVGAPGCRADGIICSGHFAQPINLNKLPKEDDVERCYRYYCPGYEHRNIGPYIPVSCTADLQYIIQTHYLLIVFSYQSVQIYLFSVM